MAPDLKGRSGAMNLTLFPLPEPKLPVPDYPNALGPSFWRLVGILGPRDCWPYLRRVSTNGYPMRTIGNRTQTAAHLILENKKGRLLHDRSADDQELVRHLCGNRMCCNPDHLDVGDYDDNAEDRKNSGRPSRRATKVTAELHNTWCDLRRRGRTILEIAEQFGVAASTVMHHTRSCNRKARRDRQLRLVA